MAKFLTATAFAQICQVDLKTIHAWVEKGPIPCIQSPGRHRRFAVVEVVAFLRRWGFPVPPTLLKGADRGLLIIGTDAMREAVVAVLGAENARPIRHAGHPYDGLVLAGAAPAAVYVVEEAALASAGVPPAAYLRGLFKAGSGRIVYVGNEAPLPPGQALPMTLVPPGDKLGLEAVTR
jgi:hypothetical protein